MSVEPIVSLFCDVVGISLPFAIVFWAGELIVTTVLRAAFGGRLSFRA